MRNSSVIRSQQPYSNNQLVNRSVKNNSELGLVKQAQNLDENRTVVYKKSKKLGFHGYPENGGYFMVEISQNLETGFLYVAAFDINSPESLLIKLPDDKAKDILE